MTNVNANSDVNINVDESHMEILLARLGYALLDLPRDDKLFLVGTMENLARRLGEVRQNRPDTRGAHCETAD